MSTFETTKKRGGKHASIPTAKNKLSATTLLRCFVAVGICIWCVFFLWIIKQARRQHVMKTSIEQVAAAAASTTNHFGGFDYVIPSELVPKRPVKVILRDHSAERIVTKDGRVSYISTEAFREYGEEVRYLVQAGRDNLLHHRGTNTTLAFRQRMHARAPWLKGDPNDPSWPSSTLPPPIDGRAIVICAGDPQLHYLKNLIYSLRVDHSSPMPVKIIFLDDNDLTPPARVQVENVIPNDRPKKIEFLNLSEIFNLKQVHLKGWDLKAYGLLAIRESELVFLDVDVMLLQPPERLFDAKGYQETGALFFHDRMLLGYTDFQFDPGTFAEGLQPNLSTIAKRLMHYGNNTPYAAEQVQESGVILIDKTRRLLGLWATCLVYAREDIRRYAQLYHMYGDKEMYWTSFETISEPYSFSRYFPGIIGGVATDFEHKEVAVFPTDKEPDVARKFEDINLNKMGLCGRLVHFDDDGEPLWTNGGYLTKEEDWASTNVIGNYPLNPVWFVDGGDWLTEDFLPEIDIGILDRIRTSFFSPYHLVAKALKEWKLVGESVLVNQNWRQSVEIGVMCLVPNNRGIQRVSVEASRVASETVKRFFNIELGGDVKYSNYF